VVDRVVGLALGEQRVAEQIGVSALEALALKPPAAIAARGEDEVIAAVQRLHHNAR